MGSGRTTRDAGSMHMAPVARSNCPSALDAAGGIGDRSRPHDVRAPGDCPAIGERPDFENCRLYAAAKMMTRLLVEDGSRA